MHWSRMPLPIGQLSKKNAYLPAMIKGEKLGAIAVQEEVRSRETVPKRCSPRVRGADFILNGTKTFVAMPVWPMSIWCSRTIQSGLTGFLVDAGTAGLSVGPRLETMGLRACPVADLSFKNVAV